MTESTVTRHSAYLFAACEAEIPDALAKLVLIDLANRANDDGECYPSVATIAKRCGISDRAVTNKIKYLVENGWVERTNRSIDGIKTSNLYRLPDSLIRTWFLSIGNSFPRVGNHVPQGREPGSDKTPIETPIKTNSSTGSTTGARMKRPALEDLEDFFLDQAATRQQAAAFFDYYNSNGWKVGKNPMRDWKAAARNWIRRDRPQPQLTREGPKRTRDMTFEEQLTDTSWAN